MRNQAGRVRLAVVVGVLLVLTVAAVVVGSVRGTLPGLEDVPGLSALPGVGPGSELERAVGLAPADAVRFSWTDWAGVRDELGVDVPADPATRDVERLLDRAFDADLSAASALGESATTAQAELGFSPATVQWELFSQGEQGALLTMSLGEGDAAASAASRVEDRLRAAGFTEPEEEDGVWEGGGDVLAALGTLTPELSYVAVDADEGLVRASDASAYLAEVVAPDAEPAEPTQGVADAVETLADAGPPLSAAVYDGSYACGALAMAAADETDQQQARTLVEQAGPVSPLAGFGLGLQPGGGATVALGFETDDQARENADARAALATGPAPGQGGTFAERFAVESTSAAGRVVTLDLDPVDGAYVLSDLSNGPVLFATC